MNVHGGPIDPTSTWWAVLAFAAIFLWGHRIRLLSRIGMDGPSIISIGAGMGTAYVFVHVMPELTTLRHEFVDSVSMTLRFEGMVMYFVALLGFLFFYGLDHWRKGLVAGEQEGGRLGYALHTGGLAVYVGLISYVLVELPEHQGGSAVFYVVVMTMHFLSINNALSEEHEDIYRRRGRYVMAAAAMVGWGIGLFATAPKHVEALLLAFVSGGVMVNSMIGELSSSKQGNILPFVLGSVIYGLILIPLR